MLKKILSLSLMLFIGVFILSGCTNKNNDEKKEINIVATIFPTYDFARSILGDKGNVTMLLPTGMESHSYEPSPRDIISINDSDLFIYTGDYMETWAKNIIDSLDNKELRILDASTGITLIKPAEHEHEHEEDHDHEHEDEHEEEHEHIHEFDPHIWTDPINCITIINSILNEIVEIDPENKEYYTANANAYIAELNKLDVEIKDIVASGKRDEIIFGTRFALLYFTNRYGLKYNAAYDTCSTEVEPSVKKIAELINEIKEEQIPVIYYEELTEPKVARSIAEGANVDMLLFHSCHNVSKDEFDSGITYLDLMKQNAENLKKGLN